MRFIAIALCAFLSAGVASAAPNNPLKVWQGGVTATQQTTACFNIFPPGFMGTGIFRPRLDPAEPASALSIIFQRSAVISVRTAGPASDKMHGQGSYRGTYINIGARVKEGFTGTFNFVLNPASPIATTQFVTMSGTITNFFGQTGCTVTIRGSFARRS
jgi:hypothetical protein